MDVVLDGINEYRRRIHVLENRCRITMQFITNAIGNERLPMLGAVDQVRQDFGERLGHVVSFYFAPSGLDLFSESQTQGGAPLCPGLD